MVTWSGYTCALVLALACIHGSSAKINMNHLCALFNDGLMIVAHDACDAYYVCRRDIATRQNCSPGHYFSKESQNCVPQEQVKCFDANTLPCSGSSIGSWAPVAGSCTDFYYCSRNGPLRARCPYGEYFSPTQQACVYPEQADCVESVESNNSGEGSSQSVTVPLPLNLCSFVKNGIFFGNPSSCSGWNKCVNNVMISGICPGTFVYNVLTMECEYPSVVNCSQVTNDPYLTSNTCSTVNATKAGNTCDTYFVCDGFHYQVVQCPNDQFFDTVSKTCVNRLDARNNCDRCLGSRSSFVNMYSTTSCTGYLYCQNGVEVASGHCPSGSYFDERAGICLQGSSDPLLGCCNPAYFNSTLDASTAANDESTTEAIESTTLATKKTTLQVEKTSTATK